MSNEIQVYNFYGNVIRTITNINGEPWFVGADVIQILGLSTAARVYARLHDNEKSYVSRTYLGLKPGKPIVIVSESGLYNLIMRSDKPEALEFQDHVASEILPSIRKHGGYIQGQKEMTDDEFMAEALLIAHSKLGEKQVVIEEKDFVIESQRGKLTHG